MFRKGSNRVCFAIISVIWLSTMPSALWAAGPEREIAGITLGRPAVAVLKKYGNPTRVIVGAVSRGAGALEAQITAAPELGPSRGVSMPGTLGGLSGLPDIFRSGAMPGVPMSLPSGPTTPGYAPGTPATGEEGATEQQVTWRYEFPSGITLDFVISAGGSVAQITVAGRTPWPLSKTARGIKLGASYKDVLFKYGFPESHETLGSFLRTSYLNKYRALFTFLGKDLVGITIALPSE